MARRYFVAVDRIVDSAWQMGLGSDLSLPEVEGKRTLEIRLMNAYLDRVLAAAEHDPVVARQFGRVIGLLDAPTSLARPATLCRVLLARTSAAVRRRTTSTSSAVRQVSP
jgi:hypothetical protein